MVMCGVLYNRYLVERWVRRLVGGDSICNGWLLWKIDAKFPLPCSWLI